MLNVVCFIQCSDIQADAGIGTESEISDSEVGQFLWLLFTENNNSLLHRSNKAK